MAPPACLRNLIVAAGMLAAALRPAAARADATAPVTRAGHQAVVRAGPAGDAPSSSASRVHFGWCDLYVPPFFEPHHGTYDLVIHFHGIPQLQEDNVDRTRIDAIVVSVNRGIASGAYAKAYPNAAAFEALLADAQRALDKTGRAPGARLGRVALSAWSAGFAAVGALLRSQEIARRVDAVLLADGLHANYLGNGAVNDAALASFVRFAADAMRGDKLFALTHSSIPTDGYPSTTQTVGELLKLTEMSKIAPLAPVPRGMRPIYESHRGGFHVEGFEGTTAKDHIDHVKGMNQTLLPYLRARWSR